MLTNDEVIKKLLWHIKKKKFMKLFPFRPWLRDAQIKNEPTSQADTIRSEAVALCKRWDTTPEAGIMCACLIDDSIAFIRKIAGAGAIADVCTIGSGECPDLDSCETITICRSKRKCQYKQHQ